MATTEDTAQANRDFREGVLGADTDLLKLQREHLAQKQQWLSGDDVIEGRTAPTEGTAGAGDGAIVWKTGPDSAA